MALIGGLVLTIAAVGGAAAMFTGVLGGSDDASDEVLHGKKVGTVRKTEGGIWVFSYSPKTVSENEGYPSAEICLQNMGGSAKDLDSMDYCVAGRRFEASEIDQNLVDTDSDTYSTQIVWKFDASWNPLMKAFRKNGGRKYLLVSLERVSSGSNSSGTTKKTKAVRFVRR